MAKENAVEYREDTGEVIEDNPSSKKLEFASMWYNPNKIQFQDLSDPYVEVFEELPPYAVDVKTGKFLNDSSQPKLVSKGKINIQEKIQSFAHETDLYTILENFAYSNDPALLNARQCSYGDLSDLPNDLNGFSQYVRNNLDKLKDMNPELLKMVVDESYSSEDIEKKANDILRERIEASKPKVEEAPKGDE